MRPDPREVHMPIASLLLARLLLGAALVIGTAAAASAQTSLNQSGLVGTPEGITIVTDPAQWPKTFNEAPQLAELVKQGKLPPVKDRLPEDLMVIKPLRRDRQVRRHLAARLHRPRRRRERQSHQRVRSADPGRLHRREADALARQGMEDERRRQDLHAQPPPRPEMVRRRAVDRRRLRLLVRGHLQQQGHRADRRFPT